MANLTSRTARRGLILLLTLAGCAGPAPQPAPQTVVVHGNSPAKAERMAEEQAELHCQGSQPLLVERSLLSAPPAFDEAHQPTSPVNEAGELAATSHEGDSPAVSLSFHCAEQPAKESKEP